MPASSPRKRGTHVTPRGVLAFVLLALASWQPAATEAQDVDRAALTRAPVASLGVSRFLADIEEPSGSLGLVGRFGWRFPGATSAVTLAHWPNVNDFRITALQAEIDLDMGRGAVRPYLSLGVGYTRGSFLRPGIANEPTGASGAFGPGVGVPLGRRLRGDFDARLRTDEYGWNAEFRLLASYTLDAAPVASASDFSLDAGLKWMTALGGPWVARDQAFFLQVAQPIQNETSLVGSLGMAFWRIPTSGPGGYIWDTGVVLASVGVRARPLSTLPFLVRLGPGVAAMGEGPDNGASFGADAEVSLPIRLGVVRLTPAVEWLWFARSGSDQHMLAWSGSIGF